MYSYPRKIKKNPVNFPDFSSHLFPSDGTVHNVFCQMNFLPFLRDLPISFHIRIREMWHSL